MYGLTETKRTLYLPPEQLDIRPGSVGIAIPGGGYVVYLLAIAWRWKPSTQLQAAWRLWYSASSM